MESAEVLTKKLFRPFLVLLDHERRKSSFSLCEGERKRVVVSSAPWHVIFVSIASVCTPQNLFDEKTQETSRFFLLLPHCLF